MKQTSLNVRKYIDKYPEHILGDISNKTFLGIESENKGFTFPYLVQLDLTNDCNLNCVGCWCHSDLMDELKFSGDHKKMHLDKKRVMKLIENLANQGTREIQLSGSGDPMMYPYFMDVVRLIKNKNLILHLITNFSLVNKKHIEDFVRLKVDRITVSLWAGTPETYARTHPNQSRKTFHRIIDNLKYLHSLKQNDNLPKIKIYYVLSSLNYHEINEMVKTALEALVDFIEFQVIDVVKGKSESIALTKEMAISMLTELYSIKNQYSSLIKRSPTSFANHCHNREFAKFARIVKEKALIPYFRYNLHDIRNLYVACPKNDGTDLPQHGCNKVEEDSEIEHAFKFYFDKRECSSKRCKFFEICPIDKDRFLVKVELLTFLGIETFIRRIKNIIKGAKRKYDTNIVDTLPCYVGWTYVRILPNGDVIPCCKAHKKPLGNINNKSFKEIWYSQKYNEFRYFAKSEKKNHPYFKVINCYKSCDNLGTNLETHKQLLNVKNN